MNILVYDTGIGLDHALSLGRECVERGDCRVYYYKEWHEPFPRWERDAHGYGFPEIVKLEDWGAVYDSADVFVFTDSGYGSLNDLLRRSGKHVFGNSVLGERLELDRSWGKRKLQELGVPVTEYVEARGLDQIMEYLLAHRDRVHYVKLSTFRGNLETMRVEEPWDFYHRIMQAGLGPFVEHVEAIIEPEAPGVEVGLDCFFNGREFVRPCFFTVEHKGHSTIGRWVWESVFDEFWLDRIEGWLASTGYHGNLSVEAFWDGSTLRVTDPTPRFPYPGSSLFPRTIENYVDVIVGVATGEVVEFRVRARYGAEIGVYTDDPGYWRPLRFPPSEYLRGVGFRSNARLADTVWYVPGDALVATANGWGDSLDEAWSAALRVADSVRATDTFHGGRERGYLDEHLRRLRELGIDF